MLARGHVVPHLDTSPTYRCSQAPFTRELRIKDIRLSALRVASQEQMLTSRTPISTLTTHIAQIPGSITTNPLTPKQALVYVIFLPSDPRNGDGTQRGRSAKAIPSAGD